MVNKARQFKKMRIPHSYAHKIIADTQAVLPGINYNKVINYNRAQAKQDITKALDTQSNRCIFEYQKIRRYVWFETTKN